MYILSGSVLTEDFFVKNMVFIGIILLMLIFYISNRFTCIEQLSKIESLKKELKDAKYEYQSVSSQLTAVSRQSQVQKLIENNGIGLIMSEKPTYSVNPLPADSDSTKSVKREAEKVIDKVKETVKNTVQ